MTAPRSTVINMDYQNPHATMPLQIPVLVLCNTPDEELEDHVRKNSARDAPWVATAKPHDGIAILVGGGPSIEDYVEEIKRLKQDGATIFAMNAAASWLRETVGVAADYQVIADAKEITSQLVDAHAEAYLFASQVHPATVDRLNGRADRLHIWHLAMEGVEEWFPQARRKRGGYALVGGGAAVGNSATCLAYVMGYRTMHLFGLDSSHRNGKSHVYTQPMNEFIPCSTVNWAGKLYQVSVAMKAQAEKFQVTAQQLKQLGCTLHVYGDGLLQAMYLTPPKNLSERNKYQLLWQFDGYRDSSPGEHVVGLFLDLVKPDNLIIDFGCGTGRAALKMVERKHEVVLVDFTDNCRDEEAMGLPFFEWDLSYPCPLRAPYGFCTDVMEHIPTEDVDAVIANIMEAATKVFFQISTVADVFGGVIGSTLHNTVRSPQWWQQTFEKLDFVIEWQSESPINAIFIVTAK